MRMVEKDCLKKETRQLQEERLHFNKRAVLVEIIAN